MLPGDLLFNNFDKWPKGRRLRGHTSKRKLRKFAGNSNGVWRITAEQLKVELVIEIVECRSGYAIDSAVFFEKRNNSERRCASLERTPVKTVYCFESRESFWGSG